MFYNLLSFGDLVAKKEGPQKHQNTKLHKEEFDVLKKDLVSFLCLRVFVAKKRNATKAQKHEIARKENS
ncbi:hypothetical protein [Tangfeifania diversioriginum]|uniref:hypothetical protein n=1 Tax=Tangfeifania diversioriginum TaxID=1168035 RepID=UPI00093552E2|nr:hypothetical protein [Tangfeifania diversioriginum]